jgi:hypothetical protein
MFKVITLAALTLSSVAMADVELRAVSPRPHTVCSISKGDVTRTMSFGKEKAVKMNAKSQFAFEGIEATARTAAKFASNRPAANENESFSMILDGNKIELDMNESPEALILVQVMVKACNL